MESLESSRPVHGLASELKEAILQLSQSQLSHQFQKPELLLQALTHSSFFNERQTKKEEFRADNERLEFLGDAVIGLVIAQSLMEQFPKASEGKLSRWRSSLVSRKTLAEIALSLGMNDWLLLGRGERQTGGAVKVSILAGVFEAVVGAFYLDAGLEKIGHFLKQAYQPWLIALTELKDSEARKLFDMKTHLQEKTQEIYRSVPAYQLVESWGPEHEKTFKVEIQIVGKHVAFGEGRSKKEAEQKAAQLALEILGF
jgi:ribonuclease III